MNEHITDEFQKLVERAQAEGEQWRIYSYRKINVLGYKHFKEIACKITKASEVRSIKGLGKDGGKIEEVLKTGFRIWKLDAFQNIYYSVGEAIARKLIAKGYKTLKDDFLIRIPREESLHALNVMVKVANSIDPNIELTLMGSFRRGSPTSGDIDVILTHIDGVSHEVSYIKFMNILRKMSFIIDDLTVIGKSNHEDGHLIYKGVCRVYESSPARRIDVLVVPYHELGAALIYFTGNELFNRSIRHLANKKGLSLNQHGLFGDVIRDNNGGGKIQQGAVIASRTEQEIFDALGVPWCEPTDRNL
ncbi:hypothetical protein BC829DRAFT_386877 [Chytridium lagenaria]|nr:hypothetical protein BC829DRAFT_386877 [Chytridium lagenaria]